MVKAGVPRVTTLSTFLLSVATPALSVFTGTTTSVPPGWARVNVTVEPAPAPVSLACAVSGLLVDAGETTLLRVTPVYALTVTAAAVALSCVLSPA